MRAISIAVVVVMACLATSDVAAQRAEITASVSVRARTAVTPAIDVAVFVIPDGSESAATDLDFTAAARAMPGAAVVLAIDAGPLAGTGLGPSDQGTVAFETEGEGALRGTLPPGGRADVATWIGGGQRAGRVRLVLRGLPPGTYRLPVRLNLAERPTPSAGETSPAPVPPGRPRRGSRTGPP